MEIELEGSCGRSDLATCDGGIVRNVYLFVAVEVGLGCTLAVA